MNWSEGQLLPLLEKPPVTREQLHAYAAASLDNNRIHLDEAFAKEAGFPTVIVHGMLSMAYLADYVRYHFPAKSHSLRHLNSRFKKVTFPGDKLFCEGKVRKLVDGGSIILSLWIKNQNAEITTDGEAEIRPI